MVGGQAYENDLHVLLSLADSVCSRHDYIVFVNGIMKWQKSEIYVDYSI